jgi:hypothetical protein
VAEPERVKPVDLYANLLLDQEQSLRHKLHRNQAELSYLLKRLSHLLGDGDEPDG